MTALVSLYLAVLALLFAYGAHGYLLAALRRSGRPPARAEVRAWPAVTVQIPVYDERDVVARAIEAAGALRYPGAIEVQVLDDSTDDTPARAAAALARLRARGLRVAHLRRAGREGFKAGALAEGLRRARGELIAIFDADFVPPPDFLVATVPILLADPRAGCVQARWDHRDRGRSAITRAQAVAIDAHFAVEQAARTRHGLCAGFNGSAGVWRRAAIEDAGGWSGASLTEDLDLAYRAQVRGWRVLYAGDVSCPADLPDTLAALKAQQRRWAQGSTRTACRVLGPLWRSRLPLRAKLEGTLHLTHYAVHPLMLLSALLALPIAVLSDSGDRWWTLLPPIALATGGPAAMALAARRDLGARWPGGLRDLLWLLLVGVGLAVSNSAAVLRGLRPAPDEFVRTPKGPSYAPRRDRMGAIELGCAALCLGTAVLLAARGIPSLVPYLLLYAAGLGGVGAATVASGRGRTRRQSPEPGSGISLDSSAAETAARAACSTASATRSRSGRSASACAVGK